MYDKYSAKINTDSKSLAKVSGKKIVTMGIMKPAISEWLPGVEEKQEVEFNDYIDMPSMFELNEDELIETEDLSEPEFVDETEGYSICPDCGCSIAIENDGGNGFCTKCAPNH